jgi:hypothetical protein
MPLRMLGPMLKSADLSAAKVPEKTADPFYSTPEYRAWRELVIARANGVCQHKSCGRKERRMFAHHVVEVKDDPTRRLDPTNGICICGKHHSLVTAAAKAARLSRGDGGLIPRRSPAL